MDSSLSVRASISSQDQIGGVNIPYQSRLCFETKSHNFGCRLAYSATAGHVC